MDFFRSVFADDPHTSEHHSQPRNDDATLPDPNPNPSGAWSFGGLINTVVHDLEEFGSGLKKETALIRDVASRAAKELPASLVAGASVTQESLESVGHAIDGIGSSVWKSTAEIISQGRDAFLAPDPHSDSSENNDNNNSSIITKRLSTNNSQGPDLKRYSRFDAQVRAIQGDMNTYLEEPEDLERYNEWKLGFVLDEKGEEIENLIGENGVIGEIYGKVVPSRIDKESFWGRYFYRVHKLKQAEDARAKLVKRAISGEEEEDLTWDFDDEGEENNASDSKVESSGHDNVEVGSKQKNDETPGGIKLEERSDEKGVLEGKTDSVECGRESEVSVVSSQRLLPEEEDLGWDEIEDVGSIDYKRGDAVGSVNKL
ncbi:protein DOS2-like [Juglans microcarpa x Juglans regia]|uniref:protein DOS2-like n=1 Tax=Juglans microcarpa x Juglans regia TaxID=2249226 RepID=UPI001B7E0E0A|nr:protein DOS2-like [Juglans microcarpa x Juglans regia]